MKNTLFIIARTLCNIAILCYFMVCIFPITLVRHYSVLCMTSYNYLGTFSNLQITESRCICICHSMLLYA